VAQGASRSIDQQISGLILFDRTIQTAVSCRGIANGPPFSEHYSQARSSSSLDPGVAEAKTLTCARRELAWNGGQFMRTTSGTHSFARWTARLAGLGRKVIA
jgi:hypothetical protein